MKIEDTIIDFSALKIPENVSPDVLKDYYSTYAKIRKNYRSAIREISTKLEILDDDFELQHKHNPIHHMESRVKSPDSILEKIQRRGLSLTKDDAHLQLTDIAGVRVICYYIEDIYMIAELLKQQTDIKVIKETDYIKKPKPNGYRSLHLVVTVPVFFVDRMQEIPVEIQIRTIAMDFWASLEHQLKYKASSKVPQFILRELKECSETIASTDLQMQKIHNFLTSIESMRETVTKEDAVLEI